MPPCENVLLKKIHRTNVITSIIKKACEQTIDIDLEEGWYINEAKKMAIQYFSGSPYPASIADITSIDSSDDDEESDNECDYESDDCDIYDTEDYS